MIEHEDPHETHPRLQAFAKREGDERLLRRLNECIADLEIEEAPGFSADRLPILYVVGAPRSGTTLLAQLLIHHFRVGYVSNLTARFYRKPAVGVALQEILQSVDSPTPELASSYGVTTGPWGQHEFGYFWRYWLGLDEHPTHYLDTQGRTHIDRCGLRRVLQQELLAGFRRPLVMKNIICGFHATVLSAVHERSLFLHIERPERDVLRSVLKARKERFGTYTAWWSIKPPTWPCPEANGDPVLEVLLQIRDTKRVTRQELAGPGVHSLEVDYERLCADPGSVLEQIGSVASCLGSPLTPSGNAPEGLVPRKGPVLDARMERRIRSGAVERGAGMKGVHRVLVRVDAGRAVEEGPGSAATARSPRVAGPSQEEVLR